MRGMGGGPWSCPFNPDPHPLLENALAAHAMSEYRHGNHVQAQRHVTQHPGSDRRMTYFERGGSHHACARSHQGRAKLSWPQASGSCSRCGNCLPIEHPVAIARLMMPSVASILLINVEVPRRGTPVLSSLPLKVLSAPHPNGLNERTHGFSVVRDTVLDSRRDFRMNGATDQPFVLQVVERGGEDLVGNLGH